MSEHQDIAQESVGSLHGLRLDRRPTGTTEIAEIVRRNEKEMALASHITSWGNTLLRGFTSSECSIVQAAGVTAPRSYDFNSISQLPLAPISRRFFGFKDIPIRLSGRWNVASLTLRPLAIRSHSAMRLARQHVRLPFSLAI
jgi:hypothetical protein